MAGEAKTKAARAATQAKHAAKNGAGAVEAVAEEGAEKASHVNPEKITLGLSETGQGFIALAFASWSAAFAFTKFKAAYEASQNLKG